MHGFSFCVKLASKMDYHSLLFLEVNFKGPSISSFWDCITHLVSEFIVSLRGKKKGRFCFGFHFCFHLDDSTFVVTKV